MNIDLSILFCSCSHHTVIFSSRKHLKHVFPCILHLRLARRVHFYKNQPAGVVVLSLLVNVWEALCVNATLPFDLVLLRIETAEYIVQVLWNSCEIKWLNCTPFPN